MTARAGAEAAGMTTGKRDRDEVFVEYTKSVCPVCKVVVDAQVNIRDDKVFLRKRCRDHGGFEALVYGDAQAYLASALLDRPRRALARRAVSDGLVGYALIIAEKR
jgi:uncharacterized radical SAM superfamily Fe-S cluster-containing enzyme